MKNNLLSVLIAIAILSCKSPAPDPSKPTSQSWFLYGIDISRYQGDQVDFMEKKKDTLFFVICKATEGLKTDDPDFKNNWDHIASKGFTRGAYHFYHSYGNPVQQAKHFLSVVKTFSVDDFPPVIDVEETSITKNSTVPDMSRNLLAFLRQVEVSTGRIPIIYTDLGTGEKYLKDPAFAAYPLWLAHYGKTEPHVLPGAWRGKQWIIWQKSDAYHLHSQTDDFDVFNGDANELKKFIKGHREL